MAGASAVSPARILDSYQKITPAGTALPWWYLFFFVSGFPALLYQIVWQRSLFTLYGVNIESVTVVVTAFMLGLGLGSLLGGAVSHRQGWPLLRIFGIVELLIGVYGVLSLRVFHWAAGYTAGSAPFQTGLVAFVLVVLPTLLMGATLPILVTYTVRLSRGVGTSVGALYAANTFGSAAACFCAGLFLMKWLGEGKTVALAAGLNAITGATVIVWDAFKRNDSRLSEEQPVSSTETNKPAFSFPAALIIAAIAGFVALGYEIMWYRLFSYTTGGLAKSFAFLLGAYLAGIAGGSLVTNRVCRITSNSQTLVRFLAVTVFGANLVGFLVGPILFNLAVHVSYLWTLAPIGIAAACLGAVFPMLCQVSVYVDENVGRRTSYLYLSNIVGSSLGSYLTGFVLMDLFSLRYVSIVLAVLGLGLGLALLLRAQLPRSGFFLAAAGVMVVMLFVIEGSEPLFHHMYEKMQLKTRYSPNMEFARVVENRSGVITVTPGGAVYGGGIYDGRFNTSLVNDTNGVERPFALSYFHPAPREVLIIGLASGSWAQIIANHPQVEHLTIVEINPGYVGLIRQVPEVASLLSNPKVNIEIDDGRRWLIRNGGRKYDAIVSNTTYNWRSHASNLLSVEFLELIRQHLKPGGVLFYNTTGSNEVMATGLRVFSCGMRLANSMVVSDTPLQLNTQRWVDMLVQYRIDGRPVFDITQELQLRRLNEVVSMAKTMDLALPTFFTLESAEHIRARTGHARIITDDNMGTEWFQDAPEE